MITEITKNKKGALSQAWIDYKKAFDSVPHSWILEVMKMYGIHSWIVEFILRTMPQWRINLGLRHMKGNMEILGIKTKTGIFQRDSLSPFIFCLSLCSLSIFLNEKNSSAIKIGKAKKGKKLNHLFYMDDLKIYSKSDSDLTSLRRIVKKFSDDIRMKFGLKKCEKISIIKGKMVRSSNISLNEHTHIKELSNTESYKYLGVEESSNTHHKNMREKLKKEYYRRLRMILSTELSSPNRIMAINSLVIPVLSYSFGVVNWSKTDVQGIDRKTRKILTMFKMYHPRADTERLYVSRLEGGRGLMQV